MAGRKLQLPHSRLDGDEYMSDRLVGLTRQGLALPEHRAPDDVDWTGRAKPIALAEAVAMVDAWAPDFAPFTMHQMCRALREELSAKDDHIRSLQEQQQLLAAERDEALDWIGALKTENNSLRDYVEVVEDGRQRLLNMWIASENCVLAAVPCTAGIKDCHAPYYRHQPCCNLRVALWPGEEFPTDYLADSGEIHLFDPGSGNRPRVSAGCVKLIEPTLYERNETLDWDFKHRYLG